MKRHTRVRIHGMHCASCEVLLERRLRKIPGVSRVHVSRRHGHADITHVGSIDSAALRAAVDKDGYSLDRAPAELTSRDYIEILVTFLVVGGALFGLKHFGLLPDIAVQEGMGLGLVFVIGLLAATSSCLAVTGGLMLALAAAHAEANPHFTRGQKFVPVLYFTAGRIVGYAFFGALLGVLGSYIALSPRISGVLALFAAILMIALGLQMLFPAARRYSIPLPKFVAHWVYDASGKSYRPWAPIVLGSLTFFFPCGFTQALQFLVLAHGGAAFGAMTMGVFALGTAPMLLALGAASSSAPGPLHRFFLRVAAVLVIILGFFSLPAGLALVGL